MNTYRQPSRFSGFGYIADFACCNRNPPNPYMLPRVLVLGTGNLVSNATFCVATCPPASFFYQRIEAALIAMVLIVLLSYASGEMHSPSYARRYAHAHAIEIIN